jgi:hypothetical protein
MGEMKLVLVGVGPVKTSYSPSCTHSFITSGALSEALLEHYPVRATNQKASTDKGTIFWESLVVSANLSMQRVGRS